MPLKVPLKYICTITKRFPAYRMPRCIAGAQRDIDRSDAFVEAEPHRAFVPGHLPVPEFSSHKVSKGLQASQCRAMKRCMMQLMQLSVEVHRLLKGVFEML